MDVKPCFAARCSDVLERSSKSGLRRYVWLLRIMRWTRARSLSRMARRSRRGTSILLLDIRDGFGWAVCGGGSSYFVGYDLHGCGSETWWDDQTARETRGQSRGDVGKLSCCGAGALDQAAGAFHGILLQLA